MLKLASAAPHAFQGTVQVSNNAHSRYVAPFRDGTQSSDIELLFDDTVRVEPRMGFVWPTRSSIFMRCFATEAICVDLSGTATYSAMTNYVSIVCTAAGNGAITVLSDAESVHLPPLKTLTLKRSVDFSVLTKLLETTL